MKKIPKNIVNYFTQQAFVLVSTIDSDGHIHCAAKGIVKITSGGRVYLIDLYKGITLSNLKRNATISITSIHESDFMGYTLQGKAILVPKHKIGKDFLDRWKAIVVGRISGRVIKNIKRGQKNAHHPESRFPTPEYLIVMDVLDIVDLTPKYLHRAHFALS
jgi:hypothetical protein